MTIFIYTSFPTKFSIAKCQTIAASIAGFAAFAAFVATLFAFDAVCCITATVFAIFGAVAAAAALIDTSEESDSTLCCIDSECSFLNADCVRETIESLSWRCNSTGRVPRCLRGSWGFKSPQRRHGIGRPTARTLVCETKDMGSIPIQSPISGRSSTVERLFWKQEAGRAARPAQTNHGSVGE